MPWYIIVGRKAPESSAFFAMKEVGGVFGARADVERHSSVGRPIFDLEGAPVNEFAPRSQRRLSYARYEISSRSTSMSAHTLNPPLTQDRFNTLAMEWLCGMGYGSNPAALTSHPSYKAIVGYGSDAIPFILAQLKRAPSLLSWTLFDITGDNPVKPSEHGNVVKITRAWLKWGKKKKLI